MIRTYTAGDASALLSVWNSAGSRFGYASLEDSEFRKIFLEHPEFSADLTFVLEENGCVCGFINGCPGDGVGYITCLLLEQEADTEENVAALVSKLEEAFRNQGKNCCAVSFFNPIRLPWVIPGTPGHQHNNMPGVPEDLPLYERLRALGYMPTSRECGLYYDLAGHVTPEWIEKKAAEMAQRGYTVAPYNSCLHSGLEEMLESLGNPVWIKEITTAAREGLDLLVGLKGNVCAGFTGPVYPEKTGRGYLSGVAVAPQYERNGLGTLLFYRLLQREQEVGSKYMSIFTGVNNPAKRIYLEAGFRIARTFAVMQKEL